MADQEISLEQEKTDVTDTSLKEEQEENEEKQEEELTEDAQALKEELAKIVVHPPAVEQCVGLILFLTEYQAFWANFGLWYSLKSPLNHSKKYLKLNPNLSVQIHRGTKKSQLRDYLVQITVPKGYVTFRLVATGYRDNQDKTAWKFFTDFVCKIKLS